MVPGVHPGPRDGCLVGLRRALPLARPVGDGRNYWSVLHVEDLARLYVLAIKRAPAGTFWHAVGGKPVARAAIATAASCAAGGQGQVEPWLLHSARAPIGPFAEGLALDQHTTGSQTEQLLGWWPPSAPSVLEELERGSYVTDTAR